MQSGPAALTAGLITCLVLVPVASRALITIALPHTSRLLARLPMATLDSSPAALVKLVLGLSPAHLKT